MNMTYDADDLLSAHHFHSLNASAVGSRKLKSAN
jgi:hypothetical protein